MRTIALVLLVGGLIGCVGGLPESDVDPGILLTIESRVAVSDVEIRVRNIAYEGDEISHALGDRDLIEEPLEIMLRSGDAAFSGFGTADPYDADWSLPFGQEVLVHVQGYLAENLVGGAAGVFQFEENRQLQHTLVIVGTFNDADGDGFEACNDRSDCDCNDQDATINPFAEEDCDDFLDNNCSGLPINEGCPCNRDQYCTPLTDAFLDRAGIGMCYFGTLSCINGELETDCDGGTFAAAGVEVPDNLLDDDCDGAVDEDSECTPGQRRRCFLGWVEPFPGEPGHTYPPEIKFDFVFDSPGVICRTGEQTCGPTGRWESACEGEVRPQRALAPEIGWVELPAVPAEAICAQCDGLDNDCNGQFDEEPWFDGDEDGYTRCGTIIDTGGDPTNPDDKVTGMDAAFVDCDDSRDDVNPGMTELCGNLVDEDCRCDHGDPATQIGRPYLGPPDVATCTSPTANCPSTAAYLDCGRLPRSDMNPTGVCSDGPGDCTGCEPYYDGYYGTNNDCYLCTEQFGYACSDDGNGGLHRLRRAHAYRFGRRSPAVLHRARHGVRG